MTSALAATVPSAAADVSPVGEAQASCPHPTRSFSSLRAWAPKPRIPEWGWEEARPERWLPDRHGHDGRRGGLGTRGKALEEKAASVNHPVGGSFCPSSVGWRKDRHLGWGGGSEGSPHLAGRCLARFRLQSLSQPKQRKGGKGRRGFLGPQGQERKAERPTVRGLGEGDGEIVRACSANSASVLGMA